MTPKEAIEVLSKTNSQRDISAALAEKGIRFNQSSISRCLKDESGMSWEVGNALIELAKAEKRRKRK